MYRHARIVLQEFVSKRPLTEHRSRSLSNETTPGTSPHVPAASQKIQIQKQPVTKQNRSRSLSNKITPGARSLQVRTTLGKIKTKQDKTTQDYTKEKVMVLYASLRNIIVNPLLDLIIPGIEREDQLSKLTDFREGRWPRSHQSKGVNLHYSRCSEKPVPFKFKKALEVDDCMIKDPSLVFKSKIKRKTNFGKFFSKQKKLIKFKVKENQPKDLSSLWYKMFLKRSVDLKLESVTPSIHSGHLGRLCDFRAFDEAFNLGHTHMKENKEQQDNNKTLHNSMYSGVLNQEPEIFNDLKPEQKKFLNTNIDLEKSIESTNKSELRLPTLPKSQEKIAQEVSVHGLMENISSVSNKLQESSNLVLEGTMRIAQTDGINRRAIPPKESAVAKTKEKKTLLTARRENKSRSANDNMADRMKTGSTNHKEVLSKVGLNSSGNQRVKGININISNKQEIDKINVVKKQINVESVLSQRQEKHKAPPTISKTKNTSLDKHKHKKNKYILPLSTVEKGTNNELGYKKTPSKHKENKTEGQNAGQKNIDPKSLEVSVKSISNMVDEDRSFNEKRRLIEKTKSKNKSKLTNTTDKPKYSVKRNFKFIPTTKATEKKKTLNKNLSDTMKPKLVTFKTTDKEPHFETKETNMKGVRSDLVDVKHIVESEGKALTHKNKSSDVKQTHYKEQKLSVDRKTESTKSNQLSHAAGIVPKHDVSNQSQVQTQLGIGHNETKHGKLAQTNMSNGQPHHIQKQDGISYQNQSKSDKLRSPPKEINITKPVTKKQGDWEKSTYLFQNKAEVTEHSQLKFKTQARLNSENQHHTHNHADINNDETHPKKSQVVEKNTHKTNKIVRKSGSLEEITRGLITPSKDVEVSKIIEVDRGGANRSQSSDNKPKPEILDSDFEIKQNVLGKVSTNEANKYIQQLGNAELKKTTVPKPQFDSKKEAIRLIKDRQKQTFSDITNKRNEKFNLIKHETIKYKVHLVDKKLASENLKPKSVSETGLSKQSPIKISQDEKLQLTKDDTVKRSVSGTTNPSKVLPTKTAGGEELSSTKTAKDMARETVKPTFKKLVSDTNPSKVVSPKSGVDKDLPPIKSNSKGVERSVNDSNLSKDSLTNTTRDEKLPLTNSASNENAKPTLKRSVSTTKTAGNKTLSLTKNPTKDAESQNMKLSIKRYVIETKLSKDSPTKTVGVEKAPPTKSDQNMKPTLKTSMSETKLCRNSLSKNTGIKDLETTKSTTTEVVGENVKPTLKRSVSNIQLSKESKFKNAGAMTQKWPTKDLVSENMKTTSKRSVSETKLSKNSPTKITEEKDLVTTKSATTEVVEENIKPMLKRSVIDTHLSKDLQFKSAKAVTQRRPTKDLVSENMKTTSKRSVIETKLRKNSPTKITEEKDLATSKSTSTTNKDTTAVVGENINPTLKRSVSNAQLSKDSQFKSAGAETQESPAKDLVSERMKPPLKRSVTETELSKNSSTTNSGNEKLQPIKSAPKEIVSENIKATSKEAGNDKIISKKSSNETAYDKKLHPTIIAHKELLRENVKPTLKRSVGDTKLSKESETKTARDERPPLTKSATNVTNSEKPTVKRSVSEIKTLSKDPSTKTAEDDTLPPTKSATKNIVSENKKATLKRSVSETKFSKDSPTKTTERENLSPIKSANSQDKRYNMNSTNDLTKGGDKESSNYWNSTSTTEKINSLEGSWKSRWNQSVARDVKTNVNLQAKSKKVKPNDVKWNSAKDSSDIKVNDSIESQYKNQQLNKPQNAQHNENTKLNETEVNSIKIQQKTLSNESAAKLMPSSIRPVKINSKPNNTSKLKKINNIQQSKTSTLEKNNKFSKGLELVGKSIKNELDELKYDVVQKTKTKDAGLKAPLTNIQPQTAIEQPALNFQKADLSVKKSASLGSLLETSRIELKGKIRATLEDTTSNLFQVDSIKKDKPKSKTELNLNENLSVNKHRPPAKISSPTLATIRGKSRPSIEKGKVNNNNTLQSDSGSNNQERTKTVKEIKEKEIKDKV